jgi:hypothetical protein
MCASGARRYVLQDERHVIPLDAGHTHVARELLSGDNHRYRLLETQNGEEFLRSRQVPHHNRQMVKLLSMVLTSSLNRPVGTQ